MTSARIVTPGQAMAMIPAMIARTPITISEVEVDLNMVGSLRLAKVVAGEVDQLVPAAGQDRPAGEEADPLQLAERHVRRHGELLPPGEHVDECGPVVLERRPQRGAQFTGPLHAR